MYKQVSVFDQAQLSESIILKFVKIKMVKFVGNWIAELVLCLSSPEITKKILAWQMCLIVSMGIHTQLPLVR